MTLNVTLLFEAFSFFIAYFLIRFILLKPAVEIINQEEAYLEDLEQKLSIVNKKLEKQEEKKAELWFQAKEGFKKAWPNLNKKFSFQSAQMNPIKISEKDVQKIAKDIELKIDKRILDV